MCSAISVETVGVGDGCGEDRIQESNVLVAVRIRPLNGSELRRGTQSVLQCPSPNTVQVNLGIREKIFTFNSVFDQDASQEDIFHHCDMQRLISLALMGYACTVFAFGQTGSGKTFTVTGPVAMCAGGCGEARLSGLLCRSLAGLLEEARTRNSGRFSFSASYLEIYNEQVRDLLNPRLSDSLPVRWSKHRGFYVENLFSAKFQSLKKIVGLLEEGTRNRQTSAHHLNGNSSRSHTLLTIEIDSEAADHTHSPGFISKHGKLCFVDLAGSERVKETGSTDEMMIEANNINRSLLALGNCISALVDCRKREGHIPYRDSKLTKLLAESLGGSGVTLMIACVSPSPLSLAETMSTLRFASRARRVKNRPAVRLDPKDQLIVDLQRGMRLLQTENISMRQHLQLPLANSNKKILNGPGGCDDCRCGPTLLASASQHSLYEMLQEFVIENEQLRQERQQLLNSQENSRREHRLLLQHNRRLGRKLCRLERAILSSPHGVSRCPSGCSCHSAESCDSPQGQHNCSRYRQVSEFLNGPGHSPPLPLLPPPSTPPVLPSAPPLPTPPRLRTEANLPLRNSSKETSPGKPSTAEPHGDTGVKPDCWEPLLDQVVRLSGHPGSQTPATKHPDIHTVSSLGGGTGGEQH